MQTAGRNSDLSRGGARRSTARALYATEKINAAGQDAGLAGHLSLSAAQLYLQRLRIMREHLHLL